MKAIAIFALVALLAVPVFAVDTDDCTVTLTIEPYMDITINESEVFIEVPSEDPLGEEYFSTAPITWSYSSNVLVDIDASFEAGSQVGAGTYHTNFVAVTDAPITNGAPGAAFYPSITGLDLEDGIAGGHITLVLTIQ